MRPRIMVCQSGLQGSWLDTSRRRVVQAANIRDTGEPNVGPAEGQGGGRGGGRTRPGSMAKKLCAAKSPACSQTPFSRRTIGIRPAFCAGDTMHTVFVDGQEGTTGLQIRDRLIGHGGVSLIEIDPTSRKDTSERRRLLNQADIAFLCLPDAAAKESAALVTGGRTRLIDASTAHRTDPAWAYGLPELNRAQRTMIRSARRVANVGCHAAGFILLMHPLVAAGILPNDYPVTCHSITRYSI